MLYRPRWPLLLTLVAGVGVLLALAYLPSRRSGEALPARGGTYVEGVAGAPSTINPLFAAFNDVDRDLATLIFPGLMRLGASGDVQPDLAETMKVTPDGLTYIFELRRGLFWHDGEPLTARDVLFTIKAMQDPGFRGDSVLADLFRNAKVEASDDRTVAITLSQPFAPFAARGATVGILPEHVLNGVASSALGDAPFNRRPVGSGPFRLVSLTDARAVLAPFDLYYRGRPFLDGLQLRFYRDGPALLNALSKGEVDGALFRPGLAADDIAFLDSGGRWVRRSLHTTTFSLVYLNPASPALEASQVRRALQHGLDRQKLIQDALAGQALTLESPIVRDLWSSVASPEDYAYNADLAASLLDAEGWLQGDAGRAKDGVPLRFSLAASDDPVQVRVAGEIARQWGELGIQVEVQVSGASQFVEGVLLPRTFEAALVTVDPGPDPDPYPLWHSTQALGEGRNLASFSDPEVDRLLEDGRLTTSVGQRAEDYRSFQQIFAREQPAALLYTPTYQYVVPADLQGVSPGLLVTLSARFNDIHRWFIKRGTQGNGGG